MNKTDQFLNNLTLTKTDLGLTNNIYISHLHGEKIAVRIPKEELKDSSAFSNEEKALSLVKSLNLDAEEIFYDSETRVRATKWIEGAQTYSQCLDSNKVIRVAALLKTLHNAKLSSGCEFDGLSLLLEYKNGIKNPLYDYPSFQFILDDFKSIKNPHVLCHNDIVDGNILLTPNQDYLIDYEYSKDNDPLFDIMSFFTENQITQDSLRSLFYQHYFDNPLTETQKDHLQKYEQFHNLLWCLWANYMYDLLKEPIYLEIAQDKYRALCACIQKV